MIRKSIFIAEPSGRLEELKEKIKEILEKEEESCCGFCDDEECDCDCDIEDEDFDEKFEEDNDFEKEILIERNLIEDKVYEFNFFDSETSELIWSYYGDYNLNVAKDIFLEEHDHLDVKFYLSE